MIKAGDLSAYPTELPADGRAVSRSTYAEVFSVLGICYGADDGSSTFNLPKLNGRMWIMPRTDAALDEWGGPL